MRITCRGMRDCGDMRDMRDVIGRMRWGYAGRYWKDEVGICGTLLEG